MDSSKTAVSTGKVCLGFFVLVVVGNCLFYSILHTPTGVNAMVADRSAHRVSAKAAALAEAGVFGLVSGGTLVGAGSTEVHSPAGSPLEMAKSNFLASGISGGAFRASPVGVASLVNLPGDAPKLPSSPSGALTVRFVPSASVSGGSGGSSPQSK